MTNLKGDILYVNETASRMFGFDTNKGFIAKGVVVRYKNPKDRDVLIETLKKQRNITNFEFEALTKTGETRNILLSGALTDDVITGMISDITERKQAEESLRQTKDQLDGILHAIADGVTVIDASGRLVYANDVVALAAGYPSAEEMLRNYDPAQSAKQYDLVDEAGAPFPATQLPNRLLLDGKPAQPVTVGYRLQTTGNLRWAVVQARPIFDEQGKMQFVVTVMHDITELMQAEETLRESERKLRLIAENATDVILAYDMDRRLIYVNPALEEFTGYTVAELEEKNFINWLYPEDEAKPLALWEDLFAGKGFSGEEFRIVTKDGQIKWCLSSWGPLYDESGRQIGIQGRERDITEIKRTEQTLREGERRFREMLENVELIAVMLNVEGRVTFCNDYLLRLTGRSRADVLGQNWFAMFVPPELHVEDVFWAGMEQNTIVPHFENEILTTSGERRLVSWNNTVLQDTEGRVIGITSIGEDITEQIGRAHV
jgi:PAS domain S-box-containing protein